MKVKTKNIQIEKGDLVVEIKGSVAKGKTWIKAAIQKALQEAGYDVRVALEGSNREICVEESESPYYLRNMPDSIKANNDGRRVVILEEFAFLPEDCTPDQAKEILAKAQGPTQR